MVHAVFIIISILFPSMLYHFYVLGLDASFVLGPILFILLEGSRIFVIYVLPHTIAEAGGINSFLKAIASKLASPFKPSPPPPPDPAILEARAKAKVEQEQRSVRNALKERYLAFVDVVNKIAVVKSTKHIYNQEQANVLGINSTSYNVFDQSPDLLVEGIDRLAEYVVASVVYEMKYGALKEKMVQTKDVSSLFMGALVTKLINLSSVPRPVEAKQKPKSEVEQEIIQKGHVVWFTETLRSSISNEGVMLSLLCDKWLPNSIISEEYFPRWGKEHSKSTSQTSQAQPAKTSSGGLLDSDESQQVPQEIKSEPVNQNSKTLVPTIGEEQFVDKNQSVYFPFQMLVFLVIRGLYYAPSLSATERMKIVKALSYCSPNQNLIDEQQKDDVIPEQGSYTSNYSWNVTQIGWSFLHEWVTLLLQ